MRETTKGETKPPRREEKGRPSYINRSVNHDERKREKKETKRAHNKYPRRGEGMGKKKKGSPCPNEGQVHLS